MLSNKQGAGYIQTCVMILVLCMILAACLTFAATANTIRVVERNVRIVLDSFVMENSIVIYDSIKNGHDFTQSVDINDYRTKLISYNILTASGNDLYHYTADGSWDYRITKPTLSMTESHTLKIAAHYTITIPLYFAGTQAPFPREAELQTKSARLDELNILLNLDKKENEIVDGDRADDDEDRPKPDRGAR